MKSLHVVHQRKDHNKLLTKPASATSSATTALAATTTATLTRTRTRTKTTTTNIINAATASASASILGSVASVGSIKSLKNYRTTIKENKGEHSIKYCDLKWWTLFTMSSLAERPFSLFLKAVRVTTGITTIGTTTEKTGTTGSTTRTGTAATKRTTGRGTGTGTGTGTAATTSAGPVDGTAGGITTTTTPTTTTTITSTATSGAKAVKRLASTRNSKINTTTTAAAETITTKIAALKCNSSRKRKIISYNNNKSWIPFCLWVWIVVSSLTFVRCVPSPTSLQPPQKRGGNSMDVGKDHCNKTVDIFDDVTSPEVTPQNVGRPLTCSYRFRSLKGSPRDFVLRLRFKKFKVGTLLNATHCEGGFLQIVDGNAKTDVSNRREPGMFCGEAEQPQTFISETSYVKVLFHTDNFTDQTYFAFDSRAEQQTEVYLRYGQHPELYPNRRGEIVQGSYCEREYRDCRLQTCYVQSPAYPGLYPRALNCRYKLHTRQPYIKLYLQNEQFAVDGQRCENVMTCPIRPIGSGNEHCPYDWLAVYDGRDEHSPLIGKFCGLGKFPFSIIGTSQYMYVEFVSSPAGPLLNTGFHFNVGNWPGHVETAGIKHGICDWLLSSDSLKDSSASEGIFLSIAHWYPPNTSCSYHIKGRPGEIVRLYFPSFRINRIESPIHKYDGDCGESLTIYDSNYPDPARIIKTFCDTFSRPMEKVDFVSTSPSLYVQFDSKTGSYSGSSLYYWAHYDFFNNTRFGDPVPNTLCDEVMYAWKHPGGKIRSPMNSLIFKRTGGSDVRCQYKFVTDKRLYARAVIEVNSVSFKEMPYNTNACTRCHEERVDKLVIWEERERFQNNLACFCDNIPRAVRVISSADQMNLEMIVQGQHAITSYFKNPNPLFEASYEFAHSPLCGPITLGPSPDGELVYPFKKALAMATGPMARMPEHHYRREKCIWELKVAAQRDLWLHLEKARFGDRTCDSAKIEVYLAGRLEPRFIVCPENISLARDLPILSAADLGAMGADQEPLPVLLQYTGDGQPGKNAFRLVWTELFHLPRNPDGSLASSLLQDGGCDFKCPGDTKVCVPRHLLCNGIENCPNVTHGSTMEQLTRHIEWNLQQLGLLHRAREYGELVLNDESPEICLRQELAELPYGKLILIAVGLSLMLTLIVAIMCRMCRRSSHNHGSRF